MNLWIPGEKSFITFGSELQRLEKPVNETTPARKEPGVDVIKLVVFTSSLALEY